MESKLKNNGHEQEEGKKRLDKLNDHIRASETQFDEQKKLLADLSTGPGPGSNMSHFDDLTTAQEEVASKLGDARVDKHEDNGRKKEQEIVENFKCLFPRVFDGLINMSNPIHSGDHQYPSITRCSSRRLFFPLTTSRLSHSRRGRGSLATPGA